MAVTTLSERLRQHATAWLSSLLALVLLVLTIMYASRSYSMSNVQGIRTSSAKTILVLRLLSELTSILLSITLALTLENIKWHLIIRKKGQQMAAFLALVPGTGILGLLQILLRKGPLWSSSRLWSLSRFILLALLPILNVIIFSNIGTRLSYHAEKTVTGNFDGALGNFNASIAPTFAPIIDSLIGADFMDFLSDPRRAVEISPHAKGSIPCSTGISKTNEQTCDEVYFMPGTVLDFNLLRDGELPHADLFVVHDTPGYMLNFTTSDQEINFNLEKDCSVYGSEVAAFQICLVDRKNFIEIKINPCLNWENLEDSNCLTGRNWESLPGSSTSVSLSSRNATVGFSRLNSTIRTYRLADEWTPLGIKAADLLTAFDGLFQPTTELENLFGDLLSMVTGTQSKKFAPVFITTAVAMSSRSYNASAAKARNTNAIHSLLAIALYYCSGALFSSLSSITANSSSVNGNLDQVYEKTFDNLPIATYSIATSSYELVVSPASIWAYTILGGLFLLLSFVALCVCTFTDGEVKRPTTTAFTDLDHRRLYFGNFDPLSATATLVPELRWDDNVRINLR